MKHSRLYRPLFAMGAALLSWLGGSAGAQTSTLTRFQVSINTSILAVHPAAPFSLQFRLLDGSGLGDTNSTVLLTNFSFGTDGAASGGAKVVGDASGSLASTVTLADTDSECGFSEKFVAGARLTFNIDATLTLDTNGVSDAFVITILDSAGEAIPTRDAEGEDALVRLTTPNGFAVRLQSYATDPSLALFASGPPVSLGPLVLPEGVPPPAAPLLSISRNGDGTATVQWPASDVSFILERTPDFMSWYLVQSPGVEVGTNRTVIATIAEAPTEFYRLVR